MQANIVKFTSGKNSKKFSENHTLRQIDNKLRSFATLNTFIPILTFLLFNTIVNAQETYKYYDINKIQSNEVIKGISKDQAGFIWLATDQGVLRYDGRETEMFFKELPSPYSKKFVKRKNGQFLVLTDFGLREIIHNADTTYFRPLQVGSKDFPDILNYPKSVYEDAEGSLWIGETNNVVRINENDFKRFSLGDNYRSINYHRSFSFTEDAFGQLWIAPYNGKLLRFNSMEDDLEEVDIAYPITDVTGIITVNGDYLVIGGKEGLLKLKIDSDRNILVNEFIGGPKFVSTLILINERIYVGTWDNGLFYTDFKKKPEVFYPIENIIFNDILDFHYDPENEEIWITGSENIGLLKPSPITPVTKPGKYRAESVDLDSLGNIYFSSGSEIFMIDPLKSDDTKLIIDSKTTYFDRILVDKDKLWIGDAFGGISYFDLKDKDSIQIIDTAPRTITDIYKDSNNNIWFSGRVNEVVKINQSLEVQHYKGVNNSMVIREAPDKEIYCGANGPDSLLYSFDKLNNEFKLVNLKYNFKPTDQIRIDDIAFDSLGNLLLATNEGLLKVIEEGEEYTAKRVILKGIDPNEPIKAIAVYNNDYWLAYSHALVVYHQGEILYYTRENGLPSRLLEDRGFVMQENYLYLATAKGLAKVDTERLNFGLTPEPIFKTLLANGEKQDIINKEGVKLAYGARLQAEFVSLSYPGSNILYQTKLLGVDDNWSESSSNSSISVLGFSEGKYKLLVRARDYGKLWSNPLELTFEVRYPWYKTWWAILLFILAGIFLIFASIKVYHFHLIRQKVKLQRLIEISTREINNQKNKIIEQKNSLIQQKEELIEKNNAVYKSQQALSEADVNYLHLKEKQLQDQIEYRNKQITTHTLNIIQKNEMLKELRERLEDIVKATDGAPHNELKKLLKIIDESFRLDKDWEEFKLYFEQIYTGFYAKLKINYPELTNQELRHCALIRLNLSNNECASILGISPNSIKVSRTRLRKKLNLENHHSLTDFVMGI